MADSLANRMTELSELYNSIFSTSGTFGHFLRSQLSKDILKTCNITAVDLRYITLQPDTKLYSFSDHWEHETAVHVYSTRLDDPVLLTMRDMKTKADKDLDGTCCARMFVTKQPIRILSAQQPSLLELCKNWVLLHYNAQNNTGNGATNVEDDVSEMPAAVPRNIFARKSGLSFLDYALHHERINGFHSIEGVAYEEAPPTPHPSRQIALFSTESLLLQQEFVYPSKKKLRKAENGFLCCNEPSRPQADPKLSRPQADPKPSRPQAPPMKRGKSVNTPPIAAHSPGGKPFNTPPPPPHSPGGPPLPPPPFQTKVTPQPTPRPRTPTMSDEKSDGKGVVKPPPSPREVSANKTTPKDAAATVDEVPKEDEIDTKM